jgi:hypothetical protein
MSFEVDRDLVDGAREPEQLYGSIPVIGIGFNLGASSMSSPKLSARLGAERMQPDRRRSRARRNEVMQKLRLPQAAQL